MNTDRELLELAAKAAGIAVTRCRLDDPACRDMLIEKSARNAHQKFGPWNPLSDDGDALRLAARLRIRVRYTRKFSDGEEEAMSLEEIRRAIVQAAADIGRDMQ